MNTVTAISGAAILLVLVGCVTLLSWHGTIDGAAAIAFFSSISLAGIVGGAQHAATRAGARAAMHYIAPETAEIPKTTTVRKSK